MKKNLQLFISLLLFTTLLNAQSFVIYGDKCFGGTSGDGGLSMLHTLNNNMIVAGVSMSDISGNKTIARCNPLLNNTSDIWLLEFDENFNIIWQKEIGGSKGEVFPNLNYNLNNDKILFSCQSSSDSSCNKTESIRGSVGSIDQDYWFGLLDTSGNILWEKTLGGSVYDLKPEFIQLSTKEYIVGGISSSSIGADKTVPNFGNYDYWVIKLDSTGNKIWDNDYGGTGNEGNLNIHDNVLISTSNGSFVIGGTTDGPANGSISFPSKGASDFWIIKIDSAGNKIWDRRYGGVNEDKCHKIIKTNDGGFLLGGETDSPVGGDLSDDPRGGLDFWVVKLDSLGNKLWDKRFGGTSNERLYAIEKSFDGGYLIGGSTRSIISFDVSEPPYGMGDFWIIKIDSLGNKLWDKRFGGNFEDEAYSVVELADSSIALFGTTQSGTSAVKTDPGYGGLDYWVIRFKYFPATVGIEEMNLFNQSVAVFPNPAKDFITINSQNGNIKKIELVNLLGETIYSQLIENSNSSQLNLQPYPPGFYFVKISNEKYTVMKRLVKE